jgi:hypothetical protein
MKTSLSLPELALAPEALTLEILDAALAAAENALSVVHPDRKELREDYCGRLPPPSVLLAALLLDRLGDVRELLQWYRFTCRATDTTTLYDDPF